VATAIAWIVVVGASPRSAVLYFAEFTVGVSPFVV